MTEEEMARAIKLDPSQFQNLGPSLDMIMAMLEDRKRKILETYETKSVVREAKKVFHKAAKKSPQPPENLRALHREAIDQEQLYDLERLFYAVGDDADPFAQHLAALMGKLEDKYQIDELAANYHFTGNESMTIPQAIVIKEELEKLDELMDQVEQAQQTAQISIIDMDDLSQYMSEDQRHSLEEMRRMIENYVREAAEQQGIQNKNGKFQLTPSAYRVFQGKLLERCLLYTSPSPRDATLSRMPSSA